jgi:predicted nucleic acid-binding protein
MPVPASPFLDTNVLIYSVASDDARSEIAEALLAAGGVVSVQAFNEFAAAARRKLGMSWDDVTEALDAIRTLCPSPRAMTIETHDAAVKIARTYGFHMYDALVVASALAADCETLYTEDLQDGQVIEERLTIRNRFKALEG